MHYSFSHNNPLYNKAGFSIVALRGMQNGTRYTFRKSLWLIGR